jgi:guanylate kinase
VERSIPDAVFSVSMTTRAKTAADVDGVDYHFVDDAAFEKVRAEDGFLESAGIYGKKYGTPRAWVEEQLRRGRLVILEIDVQGAEQVKAKMPRSYSLYILPPSEEVLLQRLRDRRRDDEPAIQRRFAQSKAEIARSQKCGVYDKFLMNQDLAATIAEAVKLVTQERARRRAGR